LEALFFFDEGPDSGPTQKVRFAGTRNSGAGDILVRISGQAHNLNAVVVTCCPRFAAYRPTGLNMSLAPAWPSASVAGQFRVKTPLVTRFRPLSLLHRLELASKGFWGGDRIEVLRIRALLGMDGNLDYDKPYGRPKAMVGRRASFGTGRWLLAPAAGGVSVVGQLKAVLSGEVEGVDPGAEQDRPESFLLVEGRRIELPTCNVTTSAVGGRFGE